MNFTNIISYLEKLLKLHESLYTLSLQKAEVTKKNDIEALNQLMKDEQKHVASITLLENERQKELKKLFPDQTELPTIRECIALASTQSEKTKLETISAELSAVLEKVKEQNEQNQLLIHQSLQFVNFSLSLFRPQPESITYGPPKGKNTQNGESSSVFNSQA